MIGGNTLSAIVASLAAWLGTTGPALALGGLSVPDPSGVTLFALGVAGVVIGRRFSRRPPQD